MKTPLTCSRCGCQRHINELNGVNLTATGWDDDSAAICIRLVDCKSAEAEETLDWLLDALESDKEAEEISPAPEPVASKDLYATPEFQRLFPLAFDFNGVLVRRSPLSVRTFAERALAHQADYQALPSHLRAEIEHAAQRAKESQIAEQLRALSIAAAQSAGGIADRSVRGRR